MTTEEEILAIQDALDLTNGKMAELMGIHRQTYVNKKTPTDTQRAFKDKNLADLKLNLKKICVTFGI